MKHFSPDKAFFKRIIEVSSRIKKETKMFIVVKMVSCL